MLPPGNRQSAESSDLSALRPSAMCGPLAERCLQIVGGISRRGRGAPLVSGAGQDIRVMGARPRR